VGAVHLRPTFPITTPRLLLRPITDADLDPMLTYRGDPEVCRYLPFEPMTPEALRARLVGDWARHELTDAAQSLTLGVEERGTGRLVGDVVLFFHSVAHAAGEIGYVLHPHAQGRGYAHEAAAALLALAFDGLGLHRVVARLDARNGASARLATRLGLRQEAHFVRNEMFKGEWSDELVFAMLADEWPASPASVAARATSR
jgi:RimJ/RimL family protein N-acetyltransferase